MSATTVRSMLAFILENGLQMDDEIHFSLSEDSREVLGTFYDIDFVSTETFTIKDCPGKTGLFVFDLIDVTEAE